jgi:hypothetical protein
MIGKLRMKDSSSGIVHGGKEAGFWASLLKPELIGTIELHQFSEMLFSGAPGSVDGGSLLPSFPKSRSRHDRSDGFGVMRDVVAFPELFASQCRTEIGIAFLQEFSYPISFFHGYAAVSGLSPVSVDKPLCAACFYTLFEAPDMPNGEREELCGLGAIELPCQDLLKDAIPVEFLLGHGEKRHR